MNTPIARNGSSTSCNLFGKYGRPLPTRRETRRFTSWLGCYIGLSHGAIRLRKFNTEVPQTFDRHARILILDLGIDAADGKMRTRYVM